MRRHWRSQAQMWLQLALFVVLGALTAGTSRLLDVGRRGHRPASRPPRSHLFRLESLMAHRDDATLGHCGRVAHNARAVAVAMGFNHHEAEVVYWTGMLHDIGKLGVRQAVLQKQGPLDPLDWLEIERHPDLGADLLGWMGGEFDEIAAGVRAHHERWDGTGYPRRMQGNDIPLSGRIVAVVDAFEALTSERPYSAPVPPHRAMTYLHADAGTHFDPAIVPVLAELWRRGEMLVAEASPTQPAPAEVPAIQLAGY